MTEQELRDLLDRCVRAHQEMLAKSEPYRSLQTRITEAFRRAGWLSAPQGHDQRPRTPAPPR